MLVEREHISYDSSLGSAIPFGEFLDGEFGFRGDPEGFIHA